MKQQSDKNTPSLAFHVVASLCNPQLYLCLVSPLCHIEAIPKNGVWRLDREEAVQLVREMSSVCGIDLEKSSFILVPEDAEGTKSNDVQLQIKMTELNFGSRNCLYAILDERKLKFKEQKGTLLIMQP